MSYVTAHVLDSVTGTPAQGIAVALEADDGTSIANDETDAAGRVPDRGPENLESGAYRITFATGQYFAGRNQPTFYPFVTVNFTVQAEERHYHVPLLLSPFAFSTYRGS